MKFPFVRSLLATSSSQPASPTADEASVKKNLETFLNARPSTASRRRPTAGSTKWCSSPAS